MEKRLFKRKASDTDWVLFIIDLQRMLKTSNKIVLRPLFDKHHIGHFPVDAVMGMKDEIINATTTELVTTVLENIRERARDYHSQRKDKPAITSQLFSDMERLKNELDNAIEEFRKQLYEHYNINSEEPRGVAEE